jgi:hypothetical protein
MDRGGNRNRLYLIPIVPNIPEQYTSSIVRSMENRMNPRTSACRTGIIVLTVGALSACLSQQARVERHEDNLAAAGFIVRPAWNWGAWGPWGPAFGFGYGPGFGW